LSRPCEDPIYLSRGFEHKFSTDFLSFSLLLYSIIDSDVKRGRGSTDFGKRDEK